MYCLPPHMHRLQHHRLPPDGTFVIVQLLNCIRFFAIPWTVACQDYPLSLRVCLDSRPLSWWCYLTISSSATIFSFCLQSFPALGPFPMSWLFTSGGQSIGASASASVLPINPQGWSPLEWTPCSPFRKVGSPCSPRDSQESSPTPHFFKSINSSVLSFLYTPVLTSHISHLHTWPLEKP